MESRGTVAAKRGIEVQQVPSDALEDKIVITVLRAGLKSCSPGFPLEQKGDHLKQVETVDPNTNIVGMLMVQHWSKTLGG